MREILDRPRMSGKTATLKLYFHENKHKYEHFIIIGHNNESTNNLLNYFKEYTDFARTNILYSVNEFKNTLVLIDEPYLIRIEKQFSIAKELERLEKENIKLDILAIGSKPKQERYLEAFINKS